MTRITAAIISALLPASALLGQTYDFTVSSKLSSVDTSFALTAPLAGTLIGNYDAETNPGGTLTLPGLFGGSGNNPIPYSSTLSIGSEISAPPSGGFQLSVNTASMSADITGLALDLLGGETIEVGGTLTIEFNTFRTQQPTSLYIGGIPLPLPLPPIAEITSLIAVQSGPAVGTLIEQSPGIYAFAALVPVELAAVILVAGEPVGEGAPVSAVLPLGGTLDLTGEGAILSVTAESSAGDEFVIDPPLAFDGIALPVPTILPPGATANLLFGGELPSIALGFDSAVALVAIGSLACAAADLNCDGVVDAADLGLMLAAWGGRGPADLNGDGVVDGPDVGLLLAAWTS
jgi:hypothetical protein